MKLAAAVAFTLLIGNADAHGKNLEAVPKVCAPEGPICHQRGGRNNYADIHSEHTGTTQ
jgi:hypothetical protein